MTTSPNPNPDPQAKKRRKRARAFADLVRQWESMLNAVADHAAQLAPVESQRVALAESLDKARQAKGLQESHGASKQAATQTLKELMAEGRDRAIRLRGAILSQLGPTTEQLTQFGMRPIRRRPLRHQQQRA